MKKILTYFFLFFFLPVLVFAQVPDTVMVPTSINGEPRDALARFILGDTTASGQRNNPNRVYKLQRGQIYYLIGAQAYNFNLTLIGDGDESVRPPVIAPFPLESGAIPDIRMDVNGNTYFRNIYFTGFAPNGIRNNNSTNRAIALGTTTASASGRLVIEKCIFEGFRQGAVSVRPPNSTVIMKDNIVRNVARGAIEFAASFLFVGASTPIDTIIMTNNTYFNGNNYFLCTNRNPNNYIRVEHNTVYINNVNPFFSFHLCKADIKNNLFVATASWGEKESERRAENYDSQNQRLSILSLEHLPSNYATTDANRKVVLKNNAYWWPDKLKNLWASQDSIFAPVWLNDRTDSIFTNKTRYPQMVAENNLEVNPGFTDNSVVNLIDSLYEHIYMCRIDPGRSVGQLYLYKWEFPCVWPLPETFTYNNATLLTGGDDGLPVGDLNWYPDKKRIWEQNYETIGVDNGKIATVPTEFKLEQNYPNPFNPSTTISFHVPEKANVSLKVYDVLGREIATLVNQVMEVGEHTVNFNASNLTTGVYFYQMKCNNFLSVKKMMLLK